MRLSKSFIILTLLATSACSTGVSPKGFALDKTTPDEPPTATAAPSGEVALVRGFLAQLQTRSIQQGVEFCGFVGTDSAGRLVLSKPVRGDEASCLPEEPRNIQRITASYHTHGGFDPNYLGELPSPSDVEGDLAMGVNGYVSTPGGRLWFIDSRTQTLSQVCGYACLPNDSRFPRGGDGPIAEAYTFAGLSRRHGG